MKKRLFDMDIENIWIHENETKENIESHFEILNSEMEKIYMFTLSIYEYIYIYK